jgi:hypothetical protein
MMAGENINPLFVCNTLSLLTNTMHGYNFIAVKIDKYLQVIAATTTIA